MSEVEIELAAMVSAARSPAVSVGLGELPLDEPERSGEGGVHAALTLPAWGQDGERLVFEVDVGSWMGRWEGGPPVTVAQTAFGVGWRLSTPPDRAWQGFLELGGRLSVSALVVDQEVPLATVGPGGSLRTGLVKTGRLAPWVATRLGGEVHSFGDRNLAGTDSGGGEVRIQWVPSRAWVALELGVSFPAGGADPGDTKSVTPGPVPAYDPIGTAGDAPR